ncbi:MAG: penicillin-binding protein 1C [Crocinitomicaceae bacterium]|nr:penicillin-binding protein 1C [Crocinitomicaceae bacterium]
MTALKKRRVWIIILSFLGLVFYLAFPNKLFDVPYSTVLNDDSGSLLSARIASDGQWRFPTIDSVPSELETCILYFEDEYFYYHPGVNPVSTIRALKQNYSAGQIKRGGSTITMQLVRMSRGNPKRSYWEKIKEMYLAFRLEFSYSKEEILQHYVSHAPYGGNVVGVEAASWRYFNRPVDDLSWAEYATLAVLPNSPSLIRPGKNSSILKKKRNNLLKKLLENDEIDSTTYSLSLLEELPTRPSSLPSHAKHLLAQIDKMGLGGSIVETTIDGSLQKTVSRKLNNYSKQLSANEIHNACALVVSLEDGNVKAYVGNASNKDTPSSFVDLVHAKRSSGSILKPLLYAASIEEGLIHTSTLLNDVPISINGFAPTNFDKEYEGVVPANQALIRSLNIPATNLLKDYSHVRFYNLLQELGFTSINRTADNYGLSLILGGAEVSLWEVSQIYSNQARNLNAYNSKGQIKQGISLIQNQPPNATQQTFNQGTWWLISESLKEVKRPGLEAGWKQFSSSKEIAWKTGTSYGFRDAWSVGYNSDYLVAVWVGNATGEGRPGLTGVSAAAPLMFNIFDGLPDYNWFKKPAMELQSIQLCANSGLIPTSNCPTKVQTSVKESSMLLLCDYHTKILVNDRGERVFLNCNDGSIVSDTTWFVLNPIETFYYKKKHPHYRNLPSFAKGCTTTESKSIAIIYPHQNANVIIPKGFDGNYKKIVMEAAQTNNDKELFWHLDGTYIGSTLTIHKMSVEISPGDHSLSIVDKNGNTDLVKFKAH